MTYVPVDAPQFVSAFDDICLEQVGNSEAQEAKAQSAPHGLAPVGTTKTGKLRFRSDEFAVDMRNSDEFCALSAVLKPDVDLNAFEAALSTQLRLGKADQLPSRDSLYWLIVPQGQNEQFVVGGKLSNERGRNLGTLIVQKRQGLTG